MESAFLIFHIYSDEDEKFLGSTTIFVKVNNYYHRK